MQQCSSLLFNVILLSSDRTIVRVTEYKGASYNDLSLMQFSASKNIAVFSHSTNWPDLAPCSSPVFPKEQIHIQRNPFCVDRRGGSKNDGAAETFLQKTVCTIALHSGSIACSCVETWKGATLKANANDFLNCVCEKIYSISCAIFVTDRVVQQQRRGLCLCPSLSIFLSLYIHIYMCVCVCVCL